MASVNNKKFIIELFQELYNKLALEGLCALKGSFVLEDKNDEFFNYLVNTKDKKSNFGSLIQIPRGMRSHLKFFNNNEKKILYEINLSREPMEFNCNNNPKFCLKMVCKNIKFYKFNIGISNYVFLKFETEPTLSFRHATNAINTYVIPKPRTTTLRDCKTNKLVDSGEYDESFLDKLFFNHAENKPFEEKKQIIAANIFNMKYKEYKENKEKYTGCKMKECELGNEIYIPYSYIKDFKMPATLSIPITVTKPNSRPRTVTMPNSRPRTVTTPSSRPRTVTRQTPRTVTRPTYRIRSVTRQRPRTVTKLSSTPVTLTKLSSRTVSKPKSKSKSTPTLKSIIQLQKIKDSELNNTKQKSKNNTKKYSIFSRNLIPSIFNTTRKRQSNDLSV
jgi:hypothetical protein